MGSYFSSVRSTASLILGLVFLLSEPVWAQTADTPSAPEHKANVMTKAPEAGPKWSELSPPQQDHLKPLQQLWPSLEENRKRKWLAIAKTFPTLSPQAQATAQERMREWAALSPAQRSQARLNFAQSQQLSTDEKLAKWEAYQSLNDEEKQNLLKKKPELPKSAATSPKPIAPEKLTATPTPKDGQSKTPKIETAEVNPHTLLRVKKTKSTESSVTP